MRHQYLLIRRLRVLLERQMTRRDQPHLAQVVPWEGRGNCPEDGCTKECQAARELLALTEPFERPIETKPVKPLRLVVMRRRRAPRRTETPAVQPRLFEEAS